MAKRTANNFSKEIEGKNIVKEESEKKLGHWQNGIGHPIKSKWEVIGKIKFSESDCEESDDGDIWGERLKR